MLKTILFVNDTVLIGEDKGIQKLICGLIMHAKNRCHRLTKMFEEEKNMEDFNCPYIASIE